MSRSGHDSQVVQIRRQVVSPDAGSLPGLRLPRRMSCGWGIPTFCRALATGIAPGTQTLSLLIPRDLVRRTHGSEVRMDVSFVAQRLVPGRPQKVTVSNRFSVPEDGTCLLADRPGGELVCRYAFRSPPPTSVSGPVTIKSCDTTGGVHISTAVIHSSNGVGTKPDPVVEELLHFEGSVCPGTQLTFVTYHPADKFRIEVAVPSITLEHDTVP